MSERVTEEMSFGSVPTAEISLYLIEWGCFGLAYPDVTNAVNIPPPPRPPPSPLCNNWELWCKTGRGRRSREDDARGS